MQTNFQILFSVRVVHSYFRNDICTCLDFTANTATEKVLNKYGFTLKRNINGFDLVVNTASSPHSFLQYIKTTSGLDHFAFNIDSTNTDFVFFTELPADWLWQMEYSNQDPLNSGDNNSVALHLALTNKKASPEIGTLKIYFDNLPGVGNNHLPVNYIINLAARSTQWQYYIINKNAVPLGNPSISGKANIDFIGPEQVQLENGEDALFFYSGKTRLPLSQTPISKFDLVNKVTENTNNAIKTNAGTKMVFKNLPNPDPSNMGTVLIDGKIIPASPMYVYI